MKINFLPLALGMILTAIASPVHSQSDTDELEFKPKRLLGAFPAIKKFPIKSVKEADETLNPKDLVLGVEVDGHARAYPITMLCGPSREIINDKLGDTAIAATW